MDWGTILLLAIFSPMVILGFLLLYEMLNTAYRMARDNKVRARVRAQKEQELEDEVVDMVEEDLTDEEIDDLIEDLEKGDRRKRKRKVRPMEDEYI